jgi:hypothetical protein
MLTKTNVFQKGLRTFNELIKVLRLSDNQPLEIGLSSLFEGVRLNDLKRNTLISLQYC